jgi:protein TonB
MSRGTARVSASLRWGACFLLVLGAHASAGAFLMRHAWTDETLAGGAPVMTIALAPIAASPESADAMPAPARSDAQPESASAPKPEPVTAPEQPKSEIDAPPAPQAELPPLTPASEQKPPETVDVLPPRRPVVREAKEKAHRERHVSVAAAPPAAEHRATHAAALADGPTRHDPNAVLNWKSRLVAQIERHKHYPAEAQSRGEQGVAQVAFSVDRRGGVHGARVVHSAGSLMLDRDALAWVARAAPLPPPPPDVAGALIPIVVPLRYSVR